MSLLGTIFKFIIVIFFLYVNYFQVVFFYYICSTYHDLRKMAEIFVHYMQK